MIKRITDIFPAQSLLFFLICGAGILAFIFLIIIPSQKSAKAIDSDINQLETRIDEQRILTPVFHSLLARAKEKNPTGLPVTEKAKLPRDDMQKALDQIRGIVSRNDLNLQEITPDVNSLTQSSGYLLIQLTATGNFFNFRQFLIDLGSIPYVEHIQEIQIQPIEASRELKLKIWLAQE
jgi:Tfp pilus assembly protein PilO